MQKIVCKRCGRILKTKESRERGYGPVCWEKEGKYEAIAHQAMNADHLTIIEQLQKEVARLSAKVERLSVRQVSNGGEEVMPLAKQREEWMPIHVNPLYAEAQSKTLALAGASLLSELKDAIPEVVN